MAIVLKEAFRYKNFLNSLITSAQIYLQDSDSYMLVTEEHLKSKAVPTATDEVKSNIDNRTMSVSANTVIDFMMAVYNEIIAVDTAIDLAIQNHCSNMSTFLAENKVRQNIVQTLKSMSKSKDRVTMSTGRDYTFNSEGNQVPYVYDIKRTANIDFDRKHVKELISDLSTKSDSVSTTNDYWMSSVPVNYVPVFDINDSFEELVESFSDPVE